jgi:hypothetical protein
LESAVPTSNVRTNKVPARAVGLLVAGIAWLVVFYLSRGLYPVSSWGYWNLAIGFGAMVAALGILSKRR